MHAPAKILQSYEYFIDFSALFQQSGNGTCCIPYTGISQNIFGVVCTLRKLGVTPMPVPNHWISFFSQFVRILDFFFIFKFHQKSKSGHMATLGFAKGEHFEMFGG